MLGAVIALYIVLALIFTGLYKLLLPFLSPVYLDNSLFQIPIWLPHEISAASEVLSTLVEETCLLQKYFAKTVLHFWMFFYNTFGYVLSIIPLQIEQLLQHFLNKIPWEQFQVTTENIGQFTFLLSNCIVNNKLAIFFMLRDIILRLDYSALPPSIGKKWRENGVIFVRIIEYVYACFPIAPFAFRPHVYHNT